MGAFNFNNPLISHYHYSCAILGQNGSSGNLIVWADFTLMVLWVNLSFSFVFFVHSFLLFNSAENNIIVIYGIASHGWLPNYIWIHADFMSFILFYADF